MFFNANQGDFDTSFLSENNRIFFFLFLYEMVLKQAKNIEKCFPQQLVRQQSHPFIFPPYHMFLIELCGKSFVSFENTKHEKLDTMKYLQYKMNRFNK